MQNSLSQYSRDAVKVVCGFYTIEKLSTAKELLYDYVKKSGENDIPAYIVRKGAGRRRSDTEDIYELFQFGEQMKINLPTFAVVNTRRVSTVTPSEADVAALAVNLEVLNSKIESLSTNLNAQHESQPGNVCRLQVSTQRSDDLSTSKDLIYPVAVADNPKWATTAMNGAERWNVASIGNRPPRPPTVKGTCSTTQMVKGVPLAERRVSYFVGRLNKDTTEADVVDLLEEVGVKDVKWAYFQTGSLPSECTACVQRYLQQ